MQIFNQEHIYYRSASSNTSVLRNKNMSKAVKHSLNPLFKTLRDRKKTILLIIGVAAITLSISIIIPVLLDATVHFKFPSIGTIRTIGVKAFYDPNLQNITTQIQWGTSYPGSTKNITLYIESTSNTNTQLHVQTGNWTFFNSTDAIVSGPGNITQYLTLTWNYNGTTLNPGQQIPVTLTLSVTESSTFTQFLIDNKVTSFSFDIVISATEQTD